MIRRISLALVIATLLSVVTAQAFRFTALTAGLGAGKTAAGVSSCDTNSVNWTYTPTYSGTGSSTKVTAVQVGLIASGATSGTNCAGGTLSLVLADSSGAQLATGSQPVPTCAGSCNVSVSISGLSATATAVAAIDVGVVGP